MHVPKKDIVQFIIKEVLQERKASSQTELAERVNSKLNKVDSSYSVSEKRVRMVALNIPGIRITTFTKKGRVPGRCPSCGHAVKRIYTKNLKGKKLLLRMACAKCGYAGKQNSWEPQRYAFEIRR
jgi:predicted RNA-binding Zn-ribbon protein involved in translation (DUF1610 family)